MFFFVLEDIEPTLTIHCDLKYMESEDLRNSLSGSATIKKNEELVNERKEKIKSHLYKI